MAKLSKGNLAAQKDVQTSKVDDWNPPVVTSATATAALMLPPKSRPLPKFPTTPSHKSITNSADSERQDSSSKKKRRRRGGKRTGDSASEVTTNPSEDVTREPTPRTNGVVEVLVPASQSSTSVLPPDASAEEIRIFNNEPELYGVYASSDNGEEDEAVNERPAAIPSQKERAPSYSPSLAIRLPQSSPARGIREDSESMAAEESIKPQIESDVASLDGVKIPDPVKMANGRFKCPVATEYGCIQTFAQAKGARRHATRHLDAEKFKCDQCGKSYSRKDTFERHLKSQHKSQTKVAGAVEKSSGYPDHKQSKELVNGKQAKANGRSAGPSSDGSGTEDELEPAKQHTSNNSLQREKMSSEVNGKLKRKRSSPHTSSAAKVQSRKRLRQDQNVPNSYFQHVNVPAAITKASKSIKDTKIVESEPSDVEMSSSDEEDENRSTAENMADTVASFDTGFDVHMLDHEQRKESDHENLSDSEDMATAVDHVDDDATNEERESRKGKGEENESDEDDEGKNPQDVDITTNQQSMVQPGLAKSLTRKSKEPETRVQRQSSMDSFVHRSKSTTTSARASASSSRISVNVPVRSKVQSKITPHIPVSNHKSAKDHLSQSTDSENGDELAENASNQLNGSKIASVRNKGKGRALSEQSDEATSKQDKEQTSSEDRPRATTIARRTSSAASKSTPRARNRELIRKGKQKASDSKDSDGVERRKPQSEPIKASKKKTKHTEGGPEDQNRSKHKTSTSVANSTWREASKSGVTGKFTEKEIRILHSWRDSFCAENNMTAYEFNEMMANTASTSKTDWKYGNWITKVDFMQQYYEQLPHRNRRSMIRFRERHFQNADSSPWTEAHDKELRQLVAELGTKWVEIAQLMGRTQDAVSQRWRHKLNCGEKPALMGEWTVEEVKKLEAEVVAFAQLKKTTPDDEDLHIPWNAISKKLGNGRTAQQCSNRWRINTSKRINGKFVKVPHNDRIPGEKVQKPRTPSKMEQRLSGQATLKTSKIYKSAERVEDSDEDGEGMEEDKDDDADDESEDPEDDSGPRGDEVEVEEEDSEEEEEQTEADDDKKEETDDQQSDEHNTSDIEGKDSNGGRMDRTPDNKLSDVPSTQDLDAADIDKDQVKQGNGQTKLANSSSRSGRRGKLSHSQTQTSSSTQSQSQPPPSSLPPTFKTPAVSRNPLRKANRDHTTPDNSLSLSQLHADTQANSSAKRTTGRTNRTRVPDSAIIEIRPSPQLDLRRRPVRSSSPSMTPLSNGLRNDLANIEEEEDESSGDDAGDSGEDAEADLKSPTSFVSAMDVARKSDEDGGENNSPGTESDSGSDSDSSEASDSQSDPRAQATQTIDEDSGSTFWQSVNQNLRKLTGLSQNQSQDRKGRLSLADVLRRGTAVEESGSDDDDDDDD